MKRRGKMHCPHCDQGINDRILISWSQTLLSARYWARRKNGAGPPDGEMGRSPSGQKGEPNHEPKQETNRPKPIVLADGSQPFRALPAEEVAEIWVMALALFYDALAVYGESFCELVVGGGQFPVHEAYIKGAMHALAALRYSPKQGNN